MEIRQLRYFVAIADTGSFSEASRRCYLSQSAISQQIKLLEEEFKTTLFNRTSHSVTLTESGERFLPLARQILSDINQCQDQMGDMTQTLQGVLNIGLTFSLEPYIRRAAALYIKVHPQVQLNLRFETIPNLIRLLRAGEIDMAFSIRVEGEDEWVESKPMAEYKLCAILSDTHPLSDKKVLTFDDLRNYSLILPEDGPNRTNAIQEYLCKEAEGLNIRATVNNPSTLLHMIKQSRCISILSEWQAKNDPELKAIPIAELSEPFTTYVHRARNIYRKRSGEAFIKMLKEQL